MIFLVAAMRFNKFIFLSLTALSLAGCQSGVTNIPVSPDSELGKQMVEMDAQGRAFQNAPKFSKAMQDFEAAHGGNCTDVVFDNLQEPGQRISPFVRLYMMEGKSPTCGSKLYCARLIFDDSANTVVKKMQILFGQDEEINYRNKAMEFIRYAQAGDVQQMLADTSPLSYASDNGTTILKIYADEVVPQFQNAIVTWNARSVPNVDEKNNVGLVITGTAQGKKTFSFDIAVSYENGKFVVANIRKR